MTNWSLAQNSTNSTPSVTLSSSVNPSNPNQSVTFTATVSISNSSYNLTTNDTVTFFCDGTSFGTEHLTSGSASGIMQASQSTPKLSSGSHTILATFNSDAHFNSSNSNTLNQMVRWILVIQPDD